MSSITPITPISGLKENESSSAAARLKAAVRTEVGLVRLATGVVALHVVDDNFLQPNPGTSAADHVGCWPRTTAAMPATCGVAIEVPLMVLVAVSLVCERLAGGSGEVEKPPVAVRALDPHREERAVGVGLDGQGVARRDDALAHLVLVMLPLHPEQLVPNSGGQRRSRSTRDAVEVDGPAAGQRLHLFGL